MFDMSKQTKTTIAIVPDSRDKLQIIKSYYEDKEGKFVDMDEVLRKMLEFVPPEVKEYRK
jgi:hypothetical protein